MTKHPIRLIELWLTLVHSALCRQVANGLMVQLPVGSDLTTHGGLGEQIGLVFPCTYREQLEEEVRRTFGSAGQLMTVTDDLSLQGTAKSGLSLSRVLSELQNHLIDDDFDVPADAALLAFFLKQGEYRSRHAPLRRVSYHIVPHPDGWQLNRQGHDDGEIFSVKEVAIQAGMDQARSHASGQLIIHRADGTFEEGRTYGDPPRE